MNIQLFFTDPLYQTILLGCVAFAIVFALISILVGMGARNRVVRMLRGKNARDIDDVLVQIYRNISLFEQFQDKTKGDMLVMNNKISNSIQAVETVRFNPFKGNGTGGNQSFATAFVNENGDGVVLSSLYSSDRVSIFAKPIVKFASTYELTEEENQALQMAVQKLHQ
jgi:hypothetical protein